MATKRMGEIRIILQGVLPFAFPTLVIAEAYWKLEDMPELPKMKIALERTVTSDQALSVLIKDICDAASASLANGNHKVIQGWPSPQVLDQGGGKK